MRCLKSSNLISWLQTVLDKLKTQKSPQGFHLAGSQDFDDGSGNHQPRILVGWRSLNLLFIFMNINNKFELNYCLYTNAYTNYF